MHNWKNPIIENIPLVTDVFSLQGKYKCDDLNIRVFAYICSGSLKMPDMLLTQDELCLCLLGVLYSHKTRQILHVIFLYIMNKKAEYGGVIENNPFLQKYLSSGGN